MDKLDQVQTPISLCEYLLQCGVITEQDFAQLQGEQTVDLIAKTTGLDLPVVSLYKDQWEELSQTDLDCSIHDDALVTVDRSICCKYTILPFKVEMGSVYIACKNPHNMRMRKEVYGYLQKRLKPVYLLSRSRTILPLLHVYYRDVKQVIYKARQVSDGKSFQAGAQKILDELIDAVLLDGFMHHATDIHLVSGAKSLSYRLRTHHQFFPVVDLPAGISEGLRNRLLIRGGCAFNRLKHVQDAAISVHVDDQDIPVRVSHIPTLEGYSIVMRIIREEFLTMDEVNFHKQQWSSLEFQLEYNKGLMLICGPVGSGKTTVYYGVMKRLLAARLKVISIEDPIESEIAHAFQMDISQTQLSFQDTMKVILRQDPDVLMIGEARTEDAVRCLSEAKISGHMVVSTLHALSPWDCLIKLKKLGYQEHQLLNQTITIITARLIPRLCPHCVRTHQLSSQEKMLLKEAKIHNIVSSWHSSLGCTHCHFSGMESIRPFYDILTLAPSQLAEVGKNWDDLRSLSVLKQTIERLREHLLALAQEGRIDIKTYFSLMSV